MRAPNLWLDLTWPRAAAGRNTTPTLLKWHAAADHVERILSRRAAREWLESGDELSVALRRPPPRITRNTKGVTYCDIGANDMVMQVISAGPGDELVWVAVPWGVFLAAMGIPDTLGAAGHPAQRFLSAWTILMPRWKHGRAELADDSEEDPDGTIHSDSAALNTHTPHSRGSRPRGPRA